MIAAIRAVVTIIGLAYIGLDLAGIGKFSVLSVVIVALGLIFTHIKLEGPS